MLIGIGLLFFSGRNILGWLLTAGGALFILAGVIANLHIYFQPTSLFNTMVMLILLAGGLGLIARALRPHRGSASSDSPHTTCAIVNRSVLPDRVVSAPAQRGPSPV